MKYFIFILQTIATLFLLIFIVLNGADLIIGGGGDSGSYIIFGFALLSTIVIACTRLIIHVIRMEREEKK